VSGTAFEEWCAAQQPPRLHPHERAAILLPFRISLEQERKRHVSVKTHSPRLCASAKSADAYQGNMERALSSLNQALASLRESTANKGGHRARAMDLVRQAIDETQAGVAFAGEHGGGGR
jgi:hypothetical protein